MGKMFLAFPLSSTLTMMTVVASPMPAPYVEELHVQRRHSRPVPFYPPPEMLYDTLPVQCMPLSLSLPVRPALLSLSLRQWQRRRHLRIPLHDELQLPSSPIHP